MQKDLSLGLVILGLLGIIFFIISIILSFIWFEKIDEADLKYNDYIKSAANSPTPEMAYEFLNKALFNIEKDRLTDGNTGTFKKYPSTDIGIWYRKIKNSRNILEEVIEKENINQIEKNNAFMMVRNTILDLKTPSFINFSPIFGWYGFILSLTIIIFLTSTSIFVFCIDILK